MPRNSLDDLVEHRLGDAAGDRYMDLQVEWVPCMCEKCLPALPEKYRDGAPLLTVGGRWDRAEKKYAGAAATSKIFRLHPGQLEAAEWFVKWRAARKRGELMYQGGKLVPTWMMYGGRRGGKTNLGLRALIEHAIDEPGSIVWIAIPEFPDLPELQRDIEAQLPRAWYTWLGDPWFCWALPNGSKIYVKSSYDPQDLKEGRCDICLLNESQKHDKLAYANVLPGLADNGGLCILAMNPPQKASGEWVADLRERAMAGRAGVAVYELDPRRNPHVVGEQLDALADHMDERTFRMEVRGEFLPREDVVMYSFSPSLNVVAAPAPEYDVTTKYTERVLGQPFPRVHGCDFQLTPHMAWVTLQLFGNVDEPDIWYTDCGLIEQGVEDDMVDDMERHGYTGADPLVPDASGEWQDAERTKGRASLDVFRRRGWRKIYLPDAASKKNPPWNERLALGNALFRSAAGRRRLFVDPKCLPLIRALKLWENRNGVPNKRSEYAHLVDAATYPLCRLFPRRAPNAPFEYHRVANGRSSRRRELEDLEEI